MICGTSTGCVDGHPFRVAYAMWLWWSGLSSCRPSQHSGKRMCSRSIEPLVSGHVGTVADRATPDATPQLQNVIRVPCGLVAAALPAIMRRLFGNGLTSASVPRR